MTIKEDLWFQVLEQEEAELLACGVVEQVLERLETVLFERRIKNQLLPFTIDHAKQTILRTVQLLFRHKDSGECVVESSSWNDEPLPSPVDSWARGVIPVRMTVQPEKINEPLLSSNPVSTVTSSTVKAVSTTVPPATPPTSRRDLLGDVIEAIATTKSLRAAKSSSTSGKTVTIKESEPVRKARRTKAVHASEETPNAVLKDARHRRLGAPVTVGSPNQLPSSAGKLQRHLGSPATKSSGAVVMIGRAPSDRSATEMTVMEDNDKVVRRLANAVRPERREGEDRVASNAPFTHDSDGRILMVKRSTDKTATFGIRAKVSEGTIEPSSLVPPIPVKKDKRSNRATGSQPLSNRVSDETVDAVRGKKNSIGRLSYLADVAPIGGLVGAKNVDGMDAGLAEEEAATFIYDSSLEIPSLVDKIKLAPGVVFKENDVVRTGPTLAKRREPLPPLKKVAPPRTGGGLGVSGATEISPEQNVDAMPLYRVLNKAKPSVKNN